MIPEKSLRVFKYIEDQRIFLSDLVGNLSEEQTHFRRSENYWNINEILQHLILSESLSLAYLKKKWNYSKELPRSSFLTGIRGSVLCLSMKYPWRLKAPARVNIFDHEKKTQELLKEWEKLRRDFFDFLAGLEEKVFTMEFYKHPAVGKVTLHHMLLFFKLHIKRHTSQINRIIEISN